MATMTLERALSISRDLSLESPCIADLHTDDSKEFIRLADIALNRQAPIFAITDKNFSYKLCPICGGLLLGDVHYCGNCGQRVKLG